MGKHSVLIAICIFLFTFAECKYSANDLQFEQRELKRASTHIPEIHQYLPQDHPLYSPPSPSILANDEIKETSLTTQNTKTRSNKRSEDDESHGEYARTFIEPNTPELTTSVSGKLDQLTIRYYVVNLAVATAGNLTFTTDSSSSISMQVMDERGNSDTIYVDNEGPVSGIIGSVCPKRSSRYLLTLRSETPANFTLSLNRISTNIAYGKYTGQLQFITNGYLGIPVTSTCKNLVVTLQLPTSYSSDLYYECREQPYYCGYAGLEQDTIYKVSFSTESSYTYQWVTNCTSPGTYNLYVQTYGASKYNLSIVEGYTCPKGCLEYGICDTTTATCRCAEGYSGPACNETGTIPSEGGIPDLVDIPVNSGTFEYVVPRIQLEYPKLFPLRMVNPNPNPATELHLIITMSMIPSYAYFYYYFNAENNATHSNYTGADYGYVNNGNITLELSLCGSVREWYIGIYDIYNRVDKPNVTFTATTRNIDISGSLTFSDSFSGAAAQQAKVYYFPATTNYTIAFVEEVIPMLDGIAIDYRCTLISKITTNQDSGTRKGVYQSNLATPIGRGYYFVVKGRPGASFKATITPAANAGVCLPSRCGGTTRGVCRFDNTCRCRFSWAGASCDALDVPANNVVLVDQTPYSADIPAGPVYLGGKLNLTTPVIPVGYAIRVTVKSYNNSLNVYTSDASVTIPNEYASYNLRVNKPGTGTLNVGNSNCVRIVPTQYYMSVTTALPDSVSGYVTVTANLTNRLLTLGSNQVVVRGFEQVPYAVILPAQCATYYKATVTPGPGSYFIYGYIGTNCLQTSANLEERNGTFTASILVTNCSQALDISVYAYNSTGNFAGLTINIEPGIACPNKCSGRGECVEGKCVCDFEYTGTDCGNFDTQCSVVSDAGFCATNALRVTDGSWYNNYDYCYVKYYDYEVKSNWEYTMSQLADYNVNLTADCYQELLQIMCDATFFKCQSQSSGGSKYLLPCNCQNFTSKCIPQTFPGSLYYLNSACSSTMSYLTETGHICDPNPRSDPIRPTTGSGTGTGSTSTTGSGAILSPSSLPLLLFVVTCMSALAVLYL